VRALTNTSGAVTDTYDYDAFGNLLHSTGTSQNNYLFAGEQYDPDLHLYYNRARYLNTSTGRFWSMDTEEGSDEEPLSLHKYLYASGDSVNRIDPTGNDDIAELSASFAVQNALSAISTTLLNSPLGSGVASFVASQFIPSWVLQGLTDSTPDAVAVGVSGQVSLNTAVPLGLTGFGGFEFLGSPKTGKTAVYSDYGAGLSFGTTASSGGFGGSVGLVFNSPQSGDYNGNFTNVSVPIKALSSDLRARIQTQLSQVNITALFGGVPIAYVSLFQVVANISVAELSSGAAITFFWSPDKHDEIGWSLGVSTSGSLGASTSNLAFSSSYYEQLAPGQSVPFR